MPLIRLLQWVFHFHFSVYLPSYLRQLFLDIFLVCSIDLFHFFSHFKNKFLRVGVLLFIDESRVFFLNLFFYFCVFQILPVLSGVKPVLGRVIAGCMIAKHWGIYSTWLLQVSLFYFLNFSPVIYLDFVIFYIFFFFLLAFIAIGGFFNVAVWYFVKDVKIFDDEELTEKDPLSERDS